MLSKGLDQSGVTRHIGFLVLEERVERSELGVGGVGKREGGDLGEEIGGTGGGLRGTSGPILSQFEGTDNGEHWVISKGLNGEGMGENRGQEVF